MADIVWRQFRDTRYQVSTDNQVRSMRRGGGVMRVLTPVRGRVSIKGKWYAVRKMVAEVFGQPYTHGNALLTDEQVAEIRSKNTTTTYDDLSEQYGVSVSHIRHIIDGSRR